MRSFILVLAVFCAVASAVAGTGARTSVSGALSELISARLDQPTRRAPTARGLCAEDKPCKEGYKCVEFLRRMACLPQDSFVCSNGERACWEGQKCVSQSNFSRTMYCADPCGSDFCVTTLASTCEALPSAVEPGAKKQACRTKDGVECGSGFCLPSEVCKKGVNTASEQVSICGANGFSKEESTSTNTETQTSTTNSNIFSGNHGSGGTNLATPISLAVASVAGWFML